MKKFAVMMIMTLCMALCSMGFAACGQGELSSDNSKNPENGASGNVPQDTHTHSYSKVITEPTCYVQGYTTYKCACGDSYQDDFVDALGHDMKSVKGKPATCTESGYTDYKKCSRCDYKSDFSEIPPQHDMKSVKGKAATCTEKGYTSYRKCSRCNYIEGYKELDALSHDLELARTQAATCTEDGWKEYKCSRCTYTEKKKITKLGHDFQDGECTRCHTEAFKKQSYSGTGNFVIQNVNLPKGDYCATLSHNGKHNFIVKLYYGEKSYEYETLVNEIGKYHGMCAIDDLCDEGAEDAIINIEADGKWTIDIDLVSGTCTTNIKGSGSCVTGFVRIQKSRNVVKLTHDGNSNFIVHGYRRGGGLFNCEYIANEIGKYSGEEVVTFTADSEYYFEVDADGNWTIDFGLNDEVTQYPNTPPEDSPEDMPDVPTVADKWSYADAVDLNENSSSAAKKMGDAAKELNKITSSSYDIMKVSGLRLIISDVKLTRTYLVKMKKLADSRPVLDLVGGKYASLQEKIDNAITLCDKIKDLEITTDNFSEHFSLISDTVRDLYAECVSLNGLSVDLMGRF